MGRATVAAGRNGTALAEDAGAAAVASRLRARVPELTGGLLERARAIADPRDAADEIYLERLPAALEALLDYGVAMIEGGDRRDPGPPPAVLSEVRLAARAGVPLDAVVRRCLAASALLGDALVAEAESAGTPSDVLRRLLAAHATAFDRLLEAETREYARELARWPKGRAEQRRQCAKRLLAGEMVDPAPLGYELAGSHLALMAVGEGVEVAVRELAVELGRRLLAVEREDEPIWACWLGGVGPLASAEVVSAWRGVEPAGSQITVGEPGEDLAGWRLSHRQAKAALPLAHRKGVAVLRYADVVLDPRSCAMTWPRPRCAACTSSRWRG